jgi:hypothetical protein
MPIGTQDNLHLSIITFIAEIFICFCSHLVGMASHSHAKLLNLKLNPDSHRDVPGGNTIAA